MKGEREQYLGNSYKRIRALSLSWLGLESFPCISRMPPRCVIAACDGTAADALTDIKAVAAYT